MNGGNTYAWSLFFLLNISDYPRSAVRQLSGFVYYE